MKRILSAVSLVSLAIALLLGVGMTTAGAATAMTTSSTPSIVKGAPSDDYPKYFSCHYEKYGSHGHEKYYRCSYKYKDDGRWHEYKWWLKDHNKGYDPPGSNPDYPNYFWCSYEKYGSHGNKYRYRCYYNYYDDHWKRYYWWWNYDPPDHH